MPDSCQSDELKIAIISDLHAFDGARANDVPSTLDVSRAHTPITDHPIEALKEHIRSSRLSADLLLCPGDLTDKGKQGPLIYAWNAIHEIGDILGAQLVAATSGNHDLDSRHNESFDAKGMLQALVPPYPLPNEQDNDRYWARNFTIVDQPLYRLVVLNSSAYHGGAENEIDFGRVSHATRHALGIALSNLPTKEVNILLCHHHLLPFQAIERVAGDEMRGGSDLVELLGTQRRGNWLIIHGHKHAGRIHYGAGGADSPVILSSASLCAATTSSGLRNQFHLATVSLTHSNRFGLAGTIQSWDWIMGHGWKTPGPNSGLPSSCGFGCRESVRILANRVAAVVTAPMQEWSEIQSLIPEVNFILPQDFESLREELLQSHQIGMVVGHDGPQQVGRRQ